MTIPRDPTFVGVDLAWGERNRTGLCAVGADGRLLALDEARTDEEVLAWLEPWTEGPCVVAVDAPLVVNNPTGQRPCERELNAVFRRYDAGAHPTNTGQPAFARGPRGGRIVAALGLAVTASSTEPRRAMEVYPHPATVVLFGLERTLKYKHKTGRDLPLLQAELLRLLDLLEGLAGADPALRLDDSEAWASVRAQVAGATRKSHLRAVEDRVDAVVCAYVAAWTHHRPHEVSVFGEEATGEIVVPAGPSALSARTGD